MTQELCDRPVTITTSSIVEHIRFASHRLQHGFNRSEHQLCLPVQATRQALYTILTQSVLLMLSVGTAANATESVLSISPNVCQFPSTVARSPISEKTISMTSMTHPQRAGSAMWNGRTQAAMTMKRQTRLQDLRRHNLELVQHRGDISDVNEAHPRHGRKDHGRTEAVQEPIEADLLEGEEDDKQIAWEDDEDEKKNHYIKRAADLCRRPLASVPEHFQPQVDAYSEARDGLTTDDLLVGWHSHQIREQDIWIFQVALEQANDRTDQHEDQSRQIGSDGKKSAKHCGLRRSNTQAGL